MWCMQTGSLTSSIHAHTVCCCYRYIFKDYIRTLKLVESQSLLISGSYDHTVKLWSMEDMSLVRAFLHSGPVEFFDTCDSGCLLASASLNELILWDLQCGARKASTLAHQKTITCVRFLQKSTIVATSSLDGHVNLFSSDSLAPIYSFTFNSSVVLLSASVQPNSVIFRLTIESCFLP